ncbi:hypothetical protein Gogos_003279 [Gossypium gossypioides]|uniref:Leucine-rich repeat-containing N-terminal plant-type domain-containing protein n=1 Tax=Gossypium gossypioides TaxID=34282 RepID=A0A7J9CM22_GOSGO|nr:hypothetical protein [Gossypium gossypioides]
MGPIWFRVILITVLVLEGAVWSDGCWDEEQLRSLDLSNNDLVGCVENEAHLKWLSKLGSLETLDLSETKMKNNLLLHLGGLSSLTTLKLEGNNLEGRIHLQEGCNLINLKILDLSNNRIESIRSSHGEYVYNSFNYVSRYF